jgi:hypothetical protein
VRRSRRRLEATSVRDVGRVKTQENEQPGRF